MTVVDDYALHFKISHVLVAEFVATDGGQEAIIIVGQIKLAQV